MKVGLIGFGRLGKLLTRYMIQDFDLVIHDVVDRSEEIKSLGATPGTFEEACKCPIVIPFVPISEFESVIKKMAPLLEKGTLVADVCSVKEMPANVMKKELPDHVQILATHPMFGPDSAAKTLFGSKIVICNVRMEDNYFTDIKNYLETHGLKVIESTPETHDKEISHSLLLTHFIGRTLMAFGAKSLDIDTKGYRRLMKILGTVENDSWQLFEDMNKYNPYSLETRVEFIKAMGEIEERLES
ncbi:MAG: prephenate dehydrogenase/arogenate dehydrogenase family protein [Bacteriovoracaceae bacterium]|nr:prephenate dehydrogenase/arogenate dehydrogenase family protein [Bacteriovoracaceae bacterium]